ncbi:hypothetical protein HYALB_00004241 [Hymenoscyphus albidus]|uniref:BTB domain-containing protein n=1 Tax=Hymenoscyphus albidus TaxID=595503 RepID=A0A9N9Q0N6_9HELO|nr:hypothetical protein HYALB_00004241 [Hymenoscyphus albidus]
MMDGDWKEANERQVDLSEDDPHAVGKMLDYLYTHQYDAEETGASLVLHARLYYLEAMKTHYQHAGFGQSLGIIYYELPGSLREGRDAAIEFAAENLVDIYSEKNNALRDSLDGSGMGHILSDIVEIVAKKEVKRRELDMRTDGLSLRHNCPMCGLDTKITVVGSQMLSSPLECPVCGIQWKVLRQGV